MAILVPMMIAAATIWLILVATGPGRQGPYETDGRSTADATRDESVRSPLPDFQSTIDDSAPVDPDPLADFVPDEGLAPPGPPVTILGTVSSDTGDPVERAIVVFQHALGRRVGVFTDAQGEYRKSLPFADTWSVTVNAEGKLSAEEDIDPLPGEAEHRLDIVLRTIPIIAVHLQSPDGENLLRTLYEESIDHNRIGIAVSQSPPGDRIATSGLSLPGPAAARVRDVPRSYRQPDGQTPHYLIELQQPVDLYVSARLGDVVLATEPAPIGTEHVRLVVDPAAVRGNFASLRYRFIDAETLEPLSLARRTEPDGAVLAPNLAPGPRRLDADIAGYEEQSRIVYLEAGALLDIGDWALHRSVKIAGTFVDSNGTPAWTRFTLVALDHFHAGSSIERDSSFNVPDGRFEARGVGRGRYAIIPTSDRFAREPTLVDTTSGSVDGLRIDLQRGTRVQLMPALAENQIAHVHVLAPGDVPVFSHIFGGHSGVADVALGPGTYRLIQVDRSRSTTEQTFTVGAHPVQLEISQGDGATTSR